MTRRRGGWVEWLVGRELLAKGLTGVAGEGDVQVSWQHVYGQEVVRIYEDRSERTPRELRLFLSITLYVPPRLNVRTHDKVGSLAEAKRCFAKAWNAAKSHAR